MSSASTFRDFVLPDAETLAGLGEEVRHPLEKWAASETVSPEVVVAFYEMVAEAALKKEFQYEFNAGRLHEMQKFFPATTSGTTHPCRTSLSAAETMHAYFKEEIQKLKVFDSRGAKMCETFEGVHQKLYDAVRKSYWAGALDETARDATYSALCSTLPADWHTIRGPHWARAEEEWNSMIDRQLEATGVINPASSASLATLKFRHSSTKEMQ